MITKESPWRLHTNVTLTRRKTFHAIETPEREICFTAGRFAACLEYLNERGVDRFLIVTPHGDYIIRVEEAPDLAGVVAADTAL